jgi:DNA-binding transcriptional LysR family regulator
MNEPWVLPPLDSVPGRHITQTLGRNGLQPPQTQMVSFSVPVHYQLLATGRYVTMLPLSLLRFGKHLSLKVLPIDVPQEPYPTGAVTLSKRTLTPIAQNFLRLARTLSEPLIMSEQKVRRARTTS